MKTDEIEKTEKTASGDYLRMLTCYVIWGFQPLYFHLKPDIDGLFLLMSRILWGCVLVTVVVLLRGRGREIFIPLTAKTCPCAAAAPAQRARAGARAQQRAMR